MIINELPRYISEYYDSQAEIEWERLARHRTEFAVTLRAIEEHLPPPPARVLDCGSGPGRYAIELTRRGYQVTLFDLSAGNLRLARHKAQEAGVSLAAFEQGDATDLSRFPDGRFEAVLLLGPLYHLLALEARRQALAEAARVLAPGGVLLAAFINRYAAHRYAALSDPGWILSHAETSERVLDSGVLPPRGEGLEAFVAYLAHPAEVALLCQDVGLEVHTVLGVEGLVSLIEEQVNELDGELWDAWVDINARLAADPCIHGCVEHLLAVAVKPRWRAILREIVARLNQAGAPYKLVGGASVALQGAPQPVADLDFETSADGAARFQALFPEQVVHPVTLSASEFYRSHFGRFDFDGLAVEVMGDLQRRQGDRWLPSWACTQEQVDLDGVPVYVSWLEEETLAYLRRGRLERAAACLPRCDPARMMALLRGEVETNVI